MRKMVLLLLLVFSMSVDAENKITIHAAQLIDGKGGIVKDVFVVVEGSKIISVGHSKEKPTYELGTATLLPGGIDTHVHMSWHFDENGKTHDPDQEKENEHTLPFGLENAYATLRGGITTVQSIGSPADLLLRKHIESGPIPGPRILTSISPVTDETGDPDKIRAHVKEMAAKGADVIKIFASKSIRDGGGPTLTLDQLKAACGQAAELHLRTAVHAHGPESVRRAVDAGCTSIEHGVLLDRATLEYIAAHGAYFDPNIGLIFRNYFENKEHYIGVDNFTEEGFAKMHEAVPTALKMFHEALQVKGLKIVFGTDAVAGAHGRNFEELIYRVQEGGQNAMDAIVSATSRAAESLRLEKEIGFIAPGMTADLIALDGDPLKDITSFRKVVFVMKSGRHL